jgi:ADP-ribosyl-[dinitrogen reductase] hydrolase
MIGDVFRVFLDVNHQHVEMEELFFLHTITFLHVNYFRETRYSFWVIFISSFSHAAGALTGLAIGDALGAPLEGLPPPIRRVTEMEGSWKSGRKAGIFTDDTAQALAIAESLAVCHGYCPSDVMMRLISSYERNPDVYGPTSGRVFELVLGGMDPGDAARTAHRLSGSSRSNGSVMRGPPIGIFYAGPMVEACSEACSRLTHYDPVAGACSAFVNRMVSDLCRGSPRERAYGRALARCRSEEVAAMLGNFRRYEPVPGLDTLLATHAALTVFMTGGDFEEMLVSAINLGGDADTVGALTGALAGAAYGIAAIPARWLAALRDLHLVIPTAYRLWVASRE